MMQKKVGERMDELEKYKIDTKKYLEEYGEKLTTNLRVAMRSNSLIVKDDRYGSVDEIIFDSSEEAYDVLQMLRKVFQDIFEPFPTIKREVDVYFIEVVLGIIKKGVFINLG